MRIHLLAAALVVGLCASAAAQDASADLESSWRRGAIRGHEVARSAEGCNFFVSHAPLGDAVEPTIIIDLREGGHAVVVTPAWDIGLVRIAEGRGATVAFGGWKALRLAVFDRSGRKLLDAPVSRPEGRLFLSVKPGWDDERCRRALHAHRLTVRAIAGDRQASDELGDLAFDPEDLVERILLGDLGQAEAAAPTQPQAYQQPPPQPYQQPAPPPYPPPPPVAPQPVICSDADFQQFLGSLRRQPFDDDKLKLVRSFAKGTWLSVDQVGAIARAFSFDDGKVKAIGFMNHSIADRQNFYRLYDALTFGSSKNDLRKIEERGAEADGR